MAKEHPPSCSPDFQALFEAAPDLYLVLLPNFQIVAVSEAYLNATMTQRAQMIGHGLFEIFPDNPDDPSATGTRNLKRSLEQVLLTRQPDTMALQKYDIRRPESEGGGFEIRYWSPRNTPVLDSSGEVRYIIHRAEDVTEFIGLKQKEVELTSHAERMESEIFRRAQELQYAKRKLEDTNRQLEEANRMKSEFLANMSHELRTPLNAIIGFSDVLKDEMLGELNSEQREYVTDIFNSGLHLLSLINDILDLSKIEAGKMDLEIEAVDVDLLLSNSLSVVKERAAQHSIRLALSQKEALGRLALDPRKTKQIIFNLLSNAVKFTPDGGAVTLSARKVSATDVLDWAKAEECIVKPDIPARDSREFLEIAVLDTGSGISTEDAPRLFQEFTQLDASLTKNHEGTGLGLALVGRLLALQEGYVGLRSRVGEGCHFAVWFPWCECVDTDALEEDNFPLRQVAARTGTRLALLVEDNEHAADLLRLQLEPHGLTVSRAATAADAIRWLEEHVPEIIVLDILLPDMDGFDLLARLKRPEAPRRDVPVLIVSILSDLHKGISLGATAVLQKPVSKEELLATLDAMGVLERPSKILIIDDDPHSVEVLARYLEELGLPVFYANNGIEGIALAGKEIPDLIFLDLMMPGLSGFEVVNALHADPRTASIPIVVISAKSLNAEDKEALAGKVAAVVSKSDFSQESFLRELQHALAKPWKGRT